MSDYRLPDYIVHEIGDMQTLSDNIPRYLSERGDWRKLKEITGNGKGIIVGVGDTGVDKEHLEGDLVNVVEAKDFTNSRSGYFDVADHGSHVTCHIGAKADGRGIEGIASDCEMYHAKVLGDSGSGSSQGIADGIDWMVEKGCKIINLSLGGGFSQSIENACKRARDAGVLVFAALGNDGLRGDGHPGNSKYTIGIAAIDFNKRLANFSSRSSEAIFAGYGVQALSCITRGRYARMSGTSMATPDQVGLAALICSYCEKLGKPIQGNKDYFDRVKPFAEDLGTDGWDRGYGYGFINIWKFIEANPLPIEPVEPEPPVDPPTDPVDPINPCEDWGEFLGSITLDDDSKLNLHIKK